MLNFRLFCLFLFDPSVFEVKLPIVFADLAKHAAWIPDSDDAFGNILCYDAARADDGVCADRDAG